MQYCNTKYLRSAARGHFTLFRVDRASRHVAALAQSTNLQPLIVLVSFPSHLFRNDCTSWSSVACLLCSVRGTLSVQSAAKLQDILEVLLFIHIYVVLPTYTQSLGKEDEGSPSHACMISNIGIALIHSTTT